MDDSVAIARRYGAMVIPVAAGTFNHGLTRNLGVQYATGDLLFFTVQDAWLEEQGMLEKMALHFTDPAVMGVVGHQAVPHEKDKNPLLWFKRFSEPVINIRQVAGAQAFGNLPVSKQQALVAWDNVVAMYRKTALETQPFVATQFAEDWIWSEQALKKGWRLIHDPSLVVWHYHHRSYQYSFRVAYAVNYHLFKFLRYIPSIPSLIMPMIKATYHLCKNPALNTREKWYWLKYNYSGYLATYFSHLDFKWRLQLGGDKAVQKGYEQYCKTIPQGKIKDDE